jgi:hypothetical protein
MALKLEGYTRVFDVEPEGVVFHRNMVWATLRQLTYVLGAPTLLLGSPRTIGWPPAYCEWMVRTASQQTIVLCDCNASFNPNAHWDRPMLWNVGSLDNRYAAKNLVETGFIVALERNIALLVNCRDGSRAGRVDSVRAGAGLVGMPWKVGQEARSAIGGSIPR